jgi:hypothetical protein
MHTFIKANPPRRLGGRGISVRYDRQAIKNDISVNTVKKRVLILHFATILIAAIIIFPANAKIPICDKPSMFFKMNAPTP